MQFIEAYDGTFINIDRLDLLYVGHAGDKWWVFARVGGAEGRLAGPYSSEKVARRRLKAIVKSLSLFDQLPGKEVKK